MVFASIVFVVLVFGLGLQPARGDSAAFTGTATFQRVQAADIFANGPGFSLALAGEESFLFLDCLAGTVCDFANTTSAPAPCGYFTATGSFNGQAANCVRGNLTQLDQLLAFLAFLP